MTDQGRILRLHIRLRADRRIFLFQGGNFCSFFLTIFNLFICLRRAHFVRFFCSSKRNEPKKRAPEMLTSAKTGACYNGLIGATVLSEVRAIWLRRARYKLYRSISLDYCTLGSGFPLAP